jgi:hypothetical protein
LHYWIKCSVLNVHQAPQKTDNPATRGRMRSRGLSVRANLGGINPSGTSPRSDKISFRYIFAPELRYRAGGSEKNLTALPSSTVEKRRSEKTLLPSPLCLLLRDSKGHERRRPRDHHAEPSALKIGGGTEELLYSNTYNSTYFRLNHNYNTCSNLVIGPAPFDLPQDPRS